jgi:hypothetical protein
MLRHQTFRFGAVLPRPSQRCGCWLRPNFLNLSVRIWVQSCRRPLHRHATSPHQIEPVHGSAFWYRPSLCKVQANVLDQIAAFREVLPKQKSLEDVTAWWDRCIEIDASIETDRRASSYEKSRVQNLRTAVTDAIIRVRDYGYEPDTSRISVALTALQHSLVRRTIGP